MRIPGLIICLLFARTLFSQYSAKEIEQILAESTTPELLEKAAIMMSDGYYVAAEVLVDKLLLTDRDNANYNYRKGFILSESHHDYLHAAPYLERAAKKVDKNYDMLSAAEDGASPEVFFYLGKCYHRLNRLDEARTNYNAFMAMAGRKWPLYDQAKLALAQTQTAQKMQETPKRNVKVVNLGTTINTPDPEYSPVISFDGSSLYFTSRRKWDEGQSETSADPHYGWYPEDIYLSFRDFDGTWTPPTRLEFCDPEQNEASVSVSMDENRIYVYQDVIGNGDIFYSDFSTNRFRDIKRLDNKYVNTDGWDTHCSMSPDGRTMYFSSQRAGGMGGRDIYRIVKLPDGTWSEPVNLGPKVNTPYDEDSPFMASDNKSLYFASNGTRSMGGFDILVAVVNDDNSWSEPVNLGWPLNSTCDDLFYTETVDGRRGYITSTRDDTKGEKDIYEVQNDYLSSERGVVLNGMIVVKDNGKFPQDLVVSVTCKDCGNNFSRSVYPRARDGKFGISLESCHEYELVLLKTEGGEEFYRETLFTDCNKVKEEIYRELIIDTEKWKIAEPELVVSVGEDLGEKIHLNPVYFDYRSYNIRQDAALELDKIVKVLKEHPEISIELRSHTDARGTDEENQVLSENRAQASAAYIVSRGISPSRITYKGFGETKLLYSNDAINAMQTGQEKDFAHGRNRRTEFIVITR